MTVELFYERLIPLKHEGDCMLLAVASDGTVYVEEAYTPEVWMAQHAYAPDGTLRESQDEDFGRCRSVTPLMIPQGAARSQPGWNTGRLNFGGARHRGLRSEDRISELVRELAVADKLRLVERLALDVPPPMLIGLAESFVTSEAVIDYPETFVVCRRFRLAVMLPEVRSDAEGAYDYDTRVIHTAYLAERARDFERPLLDALDGLPGAQLHRPLDCIATHDRLYVADGGAPGRVSTVHVWRLVHHADAT
jgi:hypothetical protein